ncbi:porin family protein [Pseudomonas sp. NPDC098747]|uniref:porin family protein n=1 Tax=Pseudomonas sp. NPDC098747 TaxID=3364487 RepID=UPI00383B345A
MHFKSMAVASLVSLLSLQAFADDKGLYVGGGITSVAVDKGALSDDDTSYKAYAGYRANGYLAFEGALVDLGDFKEGEKKFEGKSAQVAAHVGFPLGQRIRMYGSLGAHAWDSDGNVDEDDTGFDLTYGAGVELDVFRNVGVRVEYEILEVGKIDVEQTSASVFALF